MLFVRDRQASTSHHLPGFLGWRGTPPGSRARPLDPPVRHLTADFPRVLCLLWSISWLWGYQLTGGETSRRASPVTRSLGSLCARNVEEKTEEMEKEIKTEVEQEGRMLICELLDYLETNCSSPLASPYSTYYLLYLLVFSSPVTYTRQKSSCM